MKTNKLLLSVIITLLATSLALPVSAAQVRDNNGNAIIYGGAYSVSELTSKLDHGTGQVHQGSSVLKDLFAKNGIYESDFGQLKDGYVTKDNKVIVGGKVVATKVYTMGRHDIEGSTKDTRFSYPIYVRHPQVSFLSSELPAFVSMNYDGSYAYAIIKPCGNIVRGPGVKHKPTPVPKPIPTPTPVPTPTPTPVPTPTPPTVVKTVVVKENETALPTSGPAEAAAGAVGLTASGGAAYAWMRSKKALLSSLKKIK